MNKNHLNILPVLVVALLAVGLTAPFGYSRRNMRDVNTAARIAKATALTDLSATIQDKNYLAAHIAANRARDLNPTDTLTMMWANMAALYSPGVDRSVYDEQMRLVLENPSTPIDYYPTLIILAKIHEPTDTLLPYRLSRLAFSRHPDNPAMATYGLRVGTSTVMSWRFDEKTSDTIPLTSWQREFARSLVSYADTLIDNFGRSTEIDMTKARLLFAVNDTAAMVTLADQMYLRDANDPGILNNLVDIFSAIGDTARVIELGLRSFELEPTAEPVLRMFRIVEDSTAVTRLKDIVMTTAENTLLEPELRASVLNAAITGMPYYNPWVGFYLDGISDYVDYPDDSLSTDDIKRLKHNDEADIRFIHRVDSMAREMIAEEPTNYMLVRYLATFGQGYGWARTFGVDYLLDYARAYPDIYRDNATSADIIVQGDLLPEGRQTAINTLIDTLIAQEPGHALYHALQKANVALKYDDLKGALAILDTVTMAGTLDMTHQMMPDADNAKIEETAKSRWISVLMLKSDVESQLDMPDKSIATLRRVLTIKPDDALSLNNLAYIMAINGGDLHEANDLVNRSLELQPDNVNAIDTKAWIQFLMGDAAGALSTIERIFTIINLPVGKINGEETAVDDANLPPAEVLDRHNINPAALTPVIAHLLAIYDALGMDDKAMATYKFVSDIDDDDENVVKFKKDHKL